ncbi:MAG: hypothetical protein S4CHLAM20_08280 [Chlamydiia bacterium]|nr:hypothetical protein [Chlamydiia bacterium]
MALQAIPPGSAVELTTFSSNNPNDPNPTVSGDSIQETVSNNPFISLERELNNVEHIVIIGVLAGVTRIAMAFIQFLVAIVDGIMEATGNGNAFGEKENHFKHAGLNLLRGLVAIIPLAGSALLRVRDLELQKREAYDHEVPEDIIVTTDYTGANAFGGGLVKTAASKIPAALFA